MSMFSELNAGKNADDVAIALRAIQKTKRY